MSEQRAQIIGRLGDDCRRIGVSPSPRQLDALVRYAEMLAKWNRISNLVAASDLQAIVSTHVVDSLTAVPYVTGPKLADIGSGAGLPGLPIAIVREDLEVVLVESRARRVRFLSQVTIELGLDNVKVVPERVETWRPPAVIDCLVCRAYGSLAEFFTHTRHLQHRECRLVAMKGRYPAAEIEALAVPMAALEVHRVTSPNRTHRHIVTIECAPIGAPG
jgi:16S rRNA (guanine527-N7)-methyltransferase